MAREPKHIDPEAVEDFHDLLARLLRDRRFFRGEAAKKDAYIERLKKELAVAKEWQGRLHEKCMSLEQIPDGVLDCWDEQYLLDHDAVLYFKKLDGGRRRVVLERRGYPKIVRTGKKGEYFLREVIEEASGRQRTSPASQAAK